ncbi:hypothetical protein GALMADRAFT_906760 [Galerina marginata CBS 339.88]|uniref:Uncharacterized protein n=1 Tax=Galerina marginata (strain CBS 339.88) TaxID=685588 RepID=A0A067SFK7_GALM3|nr:hypothetical protein GALMADRAFT_906760 [Galerina marginata CBS 339.88]
MLSAALLMLLFASMDVAFHLRHNLEAFVYFNHGGDPVEDFERTANWINVMKMGCYVAQTFVGDSILLFRCWIVYDRSWLVVSLPIVLWLGTSACGAITIYAEATLNTSSGKTKMLNSSTLLPFITSMLCLTLATNFITTFVHRIWKIRNSIKRHSAIILPSPSSSRLTNVLVVLIESGLMYTFSIIILFGVYMASNNAQYGVSNAVVQIIGITFNLIIISVDRGDATQPPSPSPSLSLSRGPRSRISQPESQRNTPLPVHLINIQTQTSVARFPDPTTPSRTHAKSGSESESGSELGVGGLGLGAERDWKLR